MKWLTKALHRTKIALRFVACGEPGVDKT